jgi:regulatory protein
MNKPKRSAFDKAVDMLARRMMTEKQMCEALEKAGSKSGCYAEDEIEDAVARLKELGYIDDKAYADRYLEVLIDKKRGRRRIRDEMLRRGIDATLIDETIGAGLSDEAERENAVALTEKMIAGLPEGADSHLTARRISRRLIGQGYSFDLINSVIAQTIRQSGDE